MNNKTVVVSKEFLSEMRRVMVEVFNEGCEQVLFPRFEELEQKIDGTKKELREEFKKGQQSLSRTLEEVSRNVDQTAKEDRDYRKRLEKVEGIVKAN